MKGTQILNNREISFFCSQMSMLQQAGIAPVEGMRILLSDAKTSDAKRIYQQILDVCSTGQPFSEGVKSCGVFPEYVLHMLRLGEESGNLDDVMSALAEYYEREEDISDSLHSAISYPFIMIGMMVVVILVLITKVLPIFNQVFKQLGSEMSGFSASLLHLGNQINQYSLIFLGFLILLLCFYFYTTKTVSGKKMLKQLGNHIPFIRSFYDSMASGRFASGMALTLSSGMDTFQSLALVSQLVENKGMQAKIESCKTALLKGSNLSEAIIEAGIFSNFYARMIAVGFRTGSTDQVMKKIADNYDKETTRKLSSIISILEPTLVIVLSLIVGLILLSVILPLMGIMSSIG